MQYMAAVETTWEFEEEVTRVQAVEEECRQKAAKEPPSKRARVYRDCILRALGGGL